MLSPLVYNTSKHRGRGAVLRCFRSDRARASKCLGRTPLTLLGWGQDAGAQGRVRDAAIRAAAARKGRQTPDALWRPCRRRTPGDATVAAREEHRARAPAACSQPSRPRMRSSCCGPKMNAPLSRAVRRPGFRPAGPGLGQAARAWWGSQV